MPPGPPSPDYIPQTRLAALTDYVPVAQSVGLDPYAMLSEFGIDARLLADPEARVLAESVTGLLEESARRSGCEWFGLLLAEKRDLASMGPLSLLVRHERTLRDVFRRLIEYRRLMSDVVEVEFEDDGEEVQLRVGVNAELATVQGTELAMALACLWLNDTIFGGWHPAEAHFRHPAPSDRKVHRRIFRCPLHFDSTFNGFVCPSAALDRANAHADAGFAQHARHFVDMLYSELPPQSLDEQVRGAIRSLLPVGGASLAKVAAQLKMHPRALQRRLAAEGVPFASLVDSLREEMARDMLANTQLPVAEVALLVGYASAPSFSRWFAGRVGEPPREWRARQPGAAGA